MTNSDTLNTAIDTLVIIGNNVIHENDSVLNTTEWVMIGTTFFLGIIALIVPYFSEKFKRKLFSGYFGVTMPVFSVKGCHFKRSNNSTKFTYSFFKIPFLNDSPLRSMRCDEFTNRSKIASAIVPSPMMSYQTDTGICEETMVDI